MVVEKISANARITFNPFGNKPRRTNGIFTGTKCSKTQHSKKSMDLVTGLYIFELLEKKANYKKKVQPTRECGTTTPDPKQREGFFIHISVTVSRK